MIRSFRLRLALGSALVSGLVLLAFGGSAWFVLKQQRRAALDEELKLFGYRVAYRAGPNVDGRRTETNMVEIFGPEEAAHRFFSLVRRRDDAVLHLTKQWPASIDPLQFGGGETPLDPQPVIPVRETDRKPNARGRTVLEPRFLLLESGGERYRLGVFSNPEMTVVLGADLDHVEAGLAQLQRAFLVALPGALVIVALGAWFLSRRSLKPVAALAGKMESIHAGGLDQRLETGSADSEFRRIIDAYNAMLARLEKSFHQAVRFSGDASHELKTPLAIMQGTLERALAESSDGSPAQATYSGLLEQVARQKATLESLLLLSRADAGELKLSRETVDFSALVRQTVEDVELLAEGKNLAVECEAEDGLAVSADPILLQQALFNLFDNAVKFNRPGGKILCRLVSADDRACLTIANSGEAIAPDARERAFHRFFRSKGEVETEGAGLGLSLVREIILAHSGVVRIVDGDEDFMTTLEVILPLSNQSDSKLMEGR